MSAGLLRFSATSPRPRLLPAQKALAGQALRTEALREKTHTGGGGGPMGPDQTPNTRLVSTKGYYVAPRLESNNVFTMETPTFFRIDPKAVGIVG